MTDEVTQEESTQEAPAAPAAPEAFSDDEIKAMMQSKQPAKEEAQEQEESEEEGEDEGSEEEETEVAEEQVEEKQEKKRSTVVSRTRFDEVNEQKNGYKSKAEQLEEKIQKVEADNAKLLALIKSAVDGKPDESEAEAEDDEIIDTALHKQVKELKADAEKTKKEQAVQGYLAALDKADQVGAAKFDDYKTAVDFVVAQEAYKIMNRAQVLGEKLTEAQAIEEAMKDLNREMFPIHNKGASSEALASYIYNRAKAGGFNAKASKQAGKPKVNMKAVQRARDEAGAPTVQRESVKITQGTNWEDDLARRAKEHGMSTSYMRAMGLA